MKFAFPSAALLIAVLALSGCNRLPSMANVAVVDLDAIARATGQDEAMQQRINSARNELNTQLTAMAGDLEQQLTAEREKLGDSASAEKQQEYQQLAAQAQQQYAQSQALAQQQAQAFQAEVVKDFRQQVADVSAEIAATRGATIVVVAGLGTLWFDSTVDITDEVIAAIRAMPTPQSATPPEAQAMPEAETPPAPAPATE